VTREGQEKVALLRSLAEELSSVRKSCGEKERREREEVLCRLNKDR